MLIPAVEVIITLILALFIGLIIPGIERKYVQARIQQRIGPPVTTSCNKFRIMGFCKVPLQGKHKA